MIKINCQGSSTATLEEMVPIQGNLKDLSDKNYLKLKKSIMEKGFIAPFFIWGDKLLDGTQRHRTLIKMKGEGIPMPDKFPIVNIDAVDIKTAKRMLLAISSQFGEMITQGLYEFLDSAEIDFPELDQDFQFDKIDFKDFEKEYFTDEIERDNASLAERFIVPPFSVLDAKQGYWQERKRKWKALIGESGETREGTLGALGFEQFKNKHSVSVFDPVLAEIIISWFCPKQGRILDSFCGDTVFARVALEKGYSFTGIEIRHEQAELNNKKINNENIKFICDDARNAKSHLQESSQDLYFCCPPYFDLEVYSSLEGDASNQKDYQSFLRLMEDAWIESFKILKEDRFFVVVVGDVRNKKGEYRGLISDFINIGKKIGLKFYNELILLEPLSLGALKANGFFESRKMVKCHQNVLVFYKGELSRIKDEFVWNYTVDELELMLPALLEN